MTRHCGSCTLCCKLIPVEELHKAAGQRCVHVRTGKGCSIYQRRPMSCREWSCMWLKGIEDDEPLALSRPDHVHYVIDEIPDIVRVTNNATGAVEQLDVMQVWVDPKFPDAWQDKGLLDMLERQKIIALVRYNSSDGFAIFPPGRSTDGQWHRSPAGSVEDLRGAQREARFAFWARQMNSPSTSEEKRNFPA